MRLVHFDTRQVCVIVCLLLTQAAVANAADYFVANNGDDFRSCSQSRNSATPKRSLYSALGCLAAGDTLQVRGGVYEEGLVDNIPSGTSWSNPVRIKAYRPNASSDPESVWLRPSAAWEYVFYLAQYQQYIELDGINLDSSRTFYGNVKIEGWSGGNPHHIRIMNAEVLGKYDGVAGGGTSQITVTNSVPGIVGGNEFINLKVHGGGDPGESSYGFYIQSSGNLIEGCEIYDISGGGVHIFNGYGFSADHNIVRGNTIRDIVRSGDWRAWGVIVASGSGNSVYNNVITNVALPGWGNAGVSVYSGFNTRVYNNTLYGSVASGIYISGGQQTEVFNNISYGNLGGNYVSETDSTIESNNVMVDPGFVDAANRDFRLRSDSIAIDRGLTLNEVSVDSRGVPRPQGNAFDVGAYEFASGASSGGGTSPPVTPSSPSADGTMVPSALFIVDNALSVWTIGAGQDIRRDGVHVSGGYGSQIRWSQGVIYVLGTDGNWWQWTGSDWTYFGTTAPGSGGQGGQGASPDGTRVSSGGSLVDNAQGTWTIGAGQAILRNGAHVGYGYGSQILWYQGSIYVAGTDGNWWQWTGNAWTFAGGDPASGGGQGGGASPDGTTYSSASRVVDRSLAVWTIGSSAEILRNGQHAGAGYGWDILWYQSGIYVLGTDYNWWKWSGGSWDFAGARPGS